METLSALLAIHAGNSLDNGEFPAQRPVTRSFYVFFDLRLNKQSSKQWWGCWFETPLWRQCNVMWLVIIVHCGRLITTAYLKSSMILVSSIVNCVHPGEVSLEFKPYSSIPTTNNSSYICVENKNGLLNHSRSQSWNITGHKRTRWNSTSMKPYVSEIERCVIGCSWHCHWYHEWAIFLSQQHNLKWCRC